ncbi:MAG: YHS domain-containing (seleno)protein [Pseudomonadota bacterium]
MIFTRRTVMASTLAGGIAIAATGALARAPEIYLDDGGLFGQGWSHAVGGHDVVAYHSLQSGAAPVMGSEDFRTEYKGASWIFSSQENLDAFVADPDRYRPRYGGYCAWAMARNKLAKGDPRVWHIRDGELFLNVSPRFKKEWLANVERDITRADKNWPDILDRN